MTLPVGQKRKREAICEESQMKNDANLHFVMMLWPGKTYRGNNSLTKEVFGHYPPSSLTVLLNS